MNRRNFIHASGVAAAALSASGSIPAQEPTNSDDALIDLFVQENDKLIDSILPKQQRVEDKPFYGGFPNAHHIYLVGRAAWNVNRMTCGLIHPKSRHFESDQIATAVTRAINFLKTQQHGDGTIDLITTNFHSPPDTGFIVEPIALALNLIRLHTPKQHRQIQALLEEFLSAAGNALAVGGIHTPNHRWVVCMALARINQLLPAPQLVNRIDQWLAEQIDIDSEGHFNERSTSVYSPLTDRCLITVARLTNRPDLLEAVRRNLELTPFLVHPNGEVVTEVSRRQDQFRIAKMGNYYYPYRYMAIADDNAQFAGMAKMIESSVGGVEKLYGDLTYLLDDDSFSRRLPQPIGPPADYEKSFPKSKIVRIRRNEIDATIIANNETFLTIHKRSVALRAVRFASAFFGKGQFKSANIENANGKYVLKQILSGPYLQPLPKNLLPADGDWNKMPKQHRPTSEVQTLNSTVTIDESNGKFTVNLDVVGTDRVPLAIELAFGQVGELSGVVPAVDVPNAFVVSGEEIVFSNGADSIRINGCDQPAHRWTQLRGALPKLGGQCAYITGYTPFHLELTIS